MHNGVYTVNTFLRPKCSQVEGIIFILSEKPKYVVIPDYENYLFFQESYLNFFFSVFSL